jgi:hypothetical protein
LAPRIRAALDALQHEILSSAAAYPPGHIERRRLLKLVDDVRELYR